MSFSLKRLKGLSFSSAKVRKGDLAGTGVKLGWSPIFSISETEQQMTEVIWPDKSLNLLHWSKDDTETEKGNLCNFYGVDGIESNGDRGMDGIGPISIQSYWDFKKIERTTSEMTLRDVPPIVEIACGRLTCCFISETRFDGKLNCSIWLWVSLLFIRDEYCCTLGLRIWWLYLL